MTNYVLIILLGIRFNITCLIFLIISATIFTNFHVIEIIKNILRKIIKLFQIETLYIYIPKESDSFNFVLPIFLFLDFVKVKKL